jgi:hypothetical protein
MALLGGFAAASFTLLGAAYAVMSFRIQLLSQRLPMEAVDEISSHTWYRGTILRLTTMFFVSLFGLIPLSTQALAWNTTNVVAIDAVLLVVALIRLPMTTQDVLGQRFPRVVAGYGMQKLSDDYLCKIGQVWTPLRPSGSAGVVVPEADTFSVLEQIEARALEARDLATANLLVRAVCGRVVEYLRSEQVSNRRRVLEWLGDYLRVVGQEAVKRDERTAVLAVELAEEILRESFKLGIVWSDRSEFLQSWKSLWEFAAIQRQTEVLVSMAHSMARVFAESLKYAPREQELTSLFHGSEDRPEHNVKAELAWDHIYLDFLPSTYRGVDVLIAEDLLKPFETVQFNLQTHIETIMSADLGDRQKNFLLLQVVSGGRFMVMEALEHGRGEEWVSCWSLDEFVIERCMTTGNRAWGLLLLNAWSELMIAAAKHDAVPWIQLNRLAATGRGFAAKHDNELVQAIVEVLAAIGRALEMHGTESARQRYLEAAAGARSIGEWDDRSESVLKANVEEVMKKFVREEEFKRLWQNEVPSRKNLDKGDFHSFPWA